MARTQAADYDLKRQLIIDKAAEQFAKCGFHGAAMSDLARACDTSKSLIYHYFPSKEDMLYEVMASHIDQLVEDTERAMHCGEDAREKLRRIIHMFMTHYVGAADRQRILLNELGNLPEDKRRIIVGKQRAIMNSVQSLLAEIDPTLKRDKHRARVRTMLLFGSINWTHTWFNPAGPVSPDMIAEMALDLVLP